MPEPGDYFPNVFDHAQTPLIREAFRLAWERLRGDHSDDGPETNVAQRRLATAIITVASAGVVNPQEIADKAIARCANGLF